jgi:hypothetical protein
LPMKVTILEHSTVVATKEYVSNDLGGEVAILHPGPEVEDGLDEVGTRVWNLI